MKKSGKTDKILLAALLAIRHEITEIFNKLPLAKSGAGENEARGRVVDSLDSILINHKTPIDIAKIYDIFKI